MINEESLTTTLSAEDFSEKTISASQLYAESLYQDILANMRRRKSKHNAARALRAQARISKRKAKRKG